MNFVRFLAIKISPIAVAVVALLICFCCCYFTLQDAVNYTSKCLFQRLFFPSNSLIHFFLIHVLLTGTRSLLGQFKIYQPECMLSISVFPIFFFFFRTTARVSLVLLPLLGISWVFGVFAVNDDTVVFQYIFTISNSIQVWNQEELANRKNLHCCIGRWVI